MTGPEASSLVRVRTGAWYSDREIDLAFPAGWQVQVHRPELPEPLDRHQVAARVHHPAAGPALRDLAHQARRVSILVDDLTRPTPAAAILPHILSEFAAAGVSPLTITVLLATGAHRVSLTREALEAKLGVEAMASCRVVVHDHRGATVRIGTTSYGTPVHLDRAVAGSDLVVGVGGVYPQHTVGFGGGSKIVLGALGTRSIAALHYRHRGGEGAYDVENDFRHDLDEVARLARLRFVVVGHVDADRALVRVTSGEPVAVHGPEVDFAMRMFRTSPPDEADVVVANAYPMDVSLTFARSKGVIPFSHAKPGASRVLIADCPEGVGRHDLFPLQRDAADRVRHLLRKVTSEPAAVPGRTLRSLRRRAGVRTRPDEGPVRPSILWCSGGYSGGPGRTGGLVPVSSWQQLIERVSSQQGDRAGLRVAVYPCAPLQIMEAGVHADEALGRPGGLGDLSGQ
ncbi:MAG TPA: lactate racemase domain-containing protein [Nocardioidaceae bacterium]|nr:lactate racemase domain-containing protein [Nocardioidaceae bacterium]